MRSLPSLLALALIGSAAAAHAQETPLWDTFNGDLRAQKFSPLTEITPENVGDLTKAWETHTGDVWTGPGDSRDEDAPGPKPTETTPATVWSATPIFANDTLYLGTPFYRIFALEPDTGAVKWTYDTGSTLEGLTQPDLKNRGVAYWQAETPEEGRPCQKRVYLGTMDGELHAVDADSGALCEDFGEAGIFDMAQVNMINARWPLSLLQPPTVLGDMLFIGWAGKDWMDQVDSPGAVYALDARTGEIRWTFHTLPPEARSVSGTANVWASMSVDPERRLLYLPVSSPSPNYYQGALPEGLPVVTSVTAVNADSGEMVWSRQLIHHDVWDYDTNAPPTLMDIEKDGETIPALVQTSKQGFLYVLNRETGEPVYPIEERPFPQTDVPGEYTSPTQPYVARPERVIDDTWPGIFELADKLSGGYCTETFEKLRYEGSYTPPSLEGSLAYPGTAGGVQWGGGAVDPRSGIYVVNYSSTAQIYKLVPREDFAARSEAGGSETAGFYPQSGAPYGFELTTFLNPLGMPCWKPPYGSITAYDMKTGDRLWDVPFGQVQRYGFYMPESWGSVTIGGPVITASGLVFIGASMDARVRAIDINSGEVLWKGLVDAPAVSLPAVYEYKGKQYVVFTAGGNSILSPKVGDQVVAFALPD